ncbi:60S ribosomal protein L12-3-like [Solanum pennellii]|uniref:60S ribosomal protein L12-3-like n=1 Tax=Solanum pennellii TaxID=28526 RepID=A0ABM1GL26_SOLPN|nr:60S ribosomal protein L12-3-like [Solanum pennellii]
MNTPFFSFKVGQPPEPPLASVTVISAVCVFLCKVSVVPSAAALVIKALKEPERDKKKTKNIKHNGNISLDVVIEIAKVMQPRSTAKDLSETVKEILGTCVFVGCTVDGKDPNDLQQEIIDGDEEIPQDRLLIDGIRVNYELIIPLMEVSSLR